MHTQVFNRVSTPLKDFSIIPTSPGIYRFLDEYQDILYIGASKNLQKRISQYFKRSKLMKKKYSQIQILTRYIEYQECCNEEVAFETERIQIWTNQPRLNVRNNGIHSFSYLILRKMPHIHLLTSTEEVLPKLKEHDEIYRINIHFKKLQILVEQIRRNLKFCTSTDTRSCWEYQLNLCTRNCDQIKSRDDQIEANNEKKLINALKSSSSELISEWTEYIEFLIDHMEFEEAQRVCTSLKALKVLKRRFVGVGHPYDQNTFIFKISADSTKLIPTTIYSYQNGKIVSKNTHIAQRTENMSLEVFILYYLQEYFQKNTTIPKKVTINHQLDSKNQFRLKKWMRRYFHKPVLLEYCKN